MNQSQQPERAHDDPWGFDRYRSYLLYERSRSSNTVRAYLSDLERMRSGCLSSGAALPVDVRLNHLRQVVHAEFESGKSARSIARLVSSVRNYFDWALGRGLTEIDPSQRLIAPKLSKTLPDVVQKGAAKSLLDAAHDAAAPGSPAQGADQGIDEATARRRHAQALRDSAMLETLYATGMRVAELCSLDLTSIDWARRTARVIGKGNKERVIPVGSVALTAIEQWVTEGRPILTSEGAALFVGMRGRRIDQRQVRTVVNEALAGQGTVRARGPHAFRHTAATHMLDEGADLRSIQEMLGHASLTTTQMYTHVSIDRLTEAFRQAHPRA